MIRLRSLHVFDSVCQYGSITKASQQINISQPAMTQSLHKLEEALGIRLFMRGQGMVVTEAGALFRKRIHSGMSHLQAAVAKCMGSAAPENPHLYRQISESHWPAFMPHLKLAVSRWPR